jgi:hypothetical protein
MDPLRQKLTRRTEKNRVDHKHPSPSERKSQLMRKKLLRGKPDVPEPEGDCFDCEKYPCGWSIRRCPNNVATLIGQCHYCGIKYRHRLVEGKTWKYCKGCREKAFGKEEMEG